MFAPGASQAAFPGQAAAVAGCAQQLLAELAGAGGEGERAESLEVSGLCLVSVVCHGLECGPRGYVQRRRLPHPLRLSKPYFITQAAELQYYEALMTLFERLGRHSAAARCALAAARQVCLLRWLFTNSRKLTCAGLVLSCMQGSRCILRVGRAGWKQA